MVDWEDVIDMAEMEGCPMCGSGNYHLEDDYMLCDDCGYKCDIDSLLD